MTIEERARESISSGGGLANNAVVLRLIGSLLLRMAPVLRVGGSVVVTRHADVVDVLERDEDFTVAEVNGPAMDRLNGPFVLGMDRSRQYDRERGILQGCVREADMARIRAFVSGTAAPLVAAGRARGRLDVVEDLARPAATRLAGSYLGVTGPDEPTMMRWMRALFWETFLDRDADPAVRRAGEQAAAEFHAHTDALVAARIASAEAGETLPDDMVSRLVLARDDPATRLSPEGIRRNLGGLVVGAVETTSKATAHAVEQLLRHDAALAGARRAAARGEIDVVAQHVFEALRFNPLNPALIRHCARDTTLSGHRIEAGDTVYVAILPAMFDPERFADPFTFRSDRVPAADLNFGHGMHACFGRYVNVVQIPELVAALLRGGGVRRAPGGRGHLRYEGPFPSRLLVDLDPTESG